MREHVRREVGRAEVDLELSGHHVLARRPAVGERLHRRLDTPQTPDVCQRAGNGASLGSVELAGCQRGRGAGRRRRRAGMLAALPAAGGDQREEGGCERESPRELQLRADLSGSLSLARAE